MAHKNRSDQCDTEKLHIKEFLRHKGILCDPEYGDAPDAVLPIEGRRVGLEHRELIEEELAAIRPSTKLLSYLVERDLNKLVINHTFDVAIDPNVDAQSFRNRSKVAALAPLIARLAFEQMDGLRVGASVHLSAQTLERRGLPDISRLTVSLLYESPEGRAFVNVIPFAWGPVASSVIAAVSEKERRIPEYKLNKALDAVWLLLVTGETWEHMTDSALLKDLRIASTFDAVYLLDLRTSEVVRLDG